MILEQLTEGRWKPGQRLSIEALARDFEVSPTPVREALVSLEQYGSIQYFANRGYVVADPPSAEQFGELIDARQLLEGAALSRAFEEWSGFVVDLRSSHAVHADAVSAIDAEDGVDYAHILHYFNADAEFHASFFRHARNRYLTSMRRNLGWDALRMRQTWAHGPERVDAGEALAEHSEILRRVEEHNHDGALRALSVHLENVRTRSGGK
ncbi:GntR family transcriptional regulator [Curtobacterium sp. BH-2-1-1]|uniref:GntR family transcriptional regulator n=1 Tax=Curtobacterium sp. BH-2-1-1 TaxID=1905847 RepID=UPI0021562E9F|nr:GntR family transcriptional regulator [Curtobacterium sp. BH-2-1-1]